MNYGRRILILFVSVLLMFAVASWMSKSTHNTQDALMKNVRTEWEARFNSDWETVYVMTTKAFKEKVQRDTFVMRANVQVKKYAIKDVNVLESGKEGLAVIEYTMSHMGFDFNTTAREKWLWEDGDWHLSLAPALSPFQGSKK